MNVRMSLGPNCVAARDNTTIVIDMANVDIVIIEDKSAVERDFASSIVPLKNMPGREISLKYVLSRL
tara:strand:+ start:325 stop:525 length:201 start_codon:yes stop_codon:yes gene_type:complete